VDDGAQRPPADSPDEETLRFNEALERTLATQPSMATADIELLRRDRRRRIALLPHASERKISAPGGELSLRTVAGQTVERVFLHVHDGGWATGGADMQDWWLKLLAEQCNAAVVSVDYRLAPEQPYPAAPDDCEAAAVWLVENAAREFGAERLAIVGESAGAHLAAVTLLRLRDRHGFKGFKAACLSFGCFDLGLTPSARNFGDRLLLINTPICKRFNAMFVPPHVDPRDPDVSPLYAALHDLPPALFTVGSLDPLLDDSLFMHARWTAAGNPAELAVFAGCVHAFSFFPLRAGERAIKQQLAFLRRAC
jgi:acetyl esterase/lipase